MVGKTDGFISIKDLTNKGPYFKCATNGQDFKCATCDNNITELRAMQLPICDDCIKDLRKIIAERRKPKDVEYERGMANV